MSSPEISEAVLFISTFSSLVRDFYTQRIRASLPARENPWKCKTNKRRKETKMKTKTKEKRRGGEERGERPERKGSGSCLELMHPWIQNKEARSI